MITADESAPTAPTSDSSQRDFVLPTQLIRRESCGCPADPTPSVWRQIS
jgi:LacI family transcriptional regulator